MTMLVYQRLSIDQRLSVDALINGNPQPGSAIRPSKSTFGCGSKLIDLPEQKLSMTYVYIDYMYIYIYTYVDRCKRTSQNN